MTIILGSSGGGGSSSAAGITFSPTGNLEAARDVQTAIAELTANYNSALGTSDQMEVRLRPVAVSGGVIFKPHEGTRVLGDVLKFDNTRGNTDFSLKSDSNPTGTEDSFDAIVYADAKPYANDGWRASASLAGTGVTISVDLLIERLSRNITRKRLVLTASAATTIRFRQAHADAWVASGGTGRADTTTTTHGGLAAMTRVTDGTLPEVRYTWGMVRPAAMDGYMNIVDGVERSTLGDGTVWMAVHSGFGPGPIKRLPLTAGLPVTIDVLYFAGTFVTRPFASEQRERLAANAIALSDGVRGDLFKRVMYATAKNCYGRLPTSTTLVLSPGPTYANRQFIRDGFWTMIGLDEPELSRLALQRFAANIGGTLAPTSIEADGTTQVQADESNSFFLAWMWWLNQRHGIHDPGGSTGDVTGLPNGVQRNAVLTGLKNEITGANYFQTQNWFDAMTGTTAGSTYVYAHGLGWVGLAAGQKFAGTSGTPSVTNALLDAVKATYQSFFNGSYLDFARLASNGSAVADSPLVTPWALTGEVLAQLFFKTALLTDAQVYGHLDQLFNFSRRALSTGEGFKVVSNPDGSYVGPSRFGGYANGTYQNGASWLLADFMAIAAGKLHGYTNHDLDDWWTQRRAFEFANSPASHERMELEGVTAGLGSGPGYGWNTFAARYEDFVGLRYQPFEP